MRFKESAKKRRLNIHVSGCTWEQLFMAEGKGGCGNTFEINLRLGRWSSHVTFKGL